MIKVVLISIKRNNQRKKMNIALDYRNQQYVQDSDGSYYYELEKLKTHDPNKTTNDWLLLM